MNPTPNVKAVSCPTCGAQVQWIEKNQYRPFCSDRCKLIDFGEWATEKHSIAGAPSFSELDENDDSIQ
jgi:endogenous inhibitor of DNA gyrase (YacG/DUF329 family)